MKHQCYLLVKSWVTGGNLNLDIAVDPWKVQILLLKNLPGALSVIAIAEKGNLFNAPETYMDKLQ